MRTRTGALVIAVTLVFAACGDESGSPGGSRGRDPDAPVTSTPIPQPSGPNKNGPQRVEPQPGMAGVRPHGFDRVKVLDDRTVRVFFYQGIAPCSVLDRVDIEYGTKTVALTLQVGHDPNAEDVACIEIAVFNYVDVELQEPLQDRRIVDGAR